jgi:hypothetical protein
VKTKEPDSPFNPDGSLNLPVVDMPDTYFFYWFCYHGGITKDDVTRKLEQWRQED